MAIVGKPSAPEMAISGADASPEMAIIGAPPRSELGPLRGVLPGAEQHVCHHPGMSSSRRSAMPEADFWSLIELLGGRVDDDGVGRLTGALRQGDDGTAVAFAERLAAVLYELDREELFEQPVRWADAPDEEPLPLSADTFLYLRCAVVAAGRATVDAVLADPAVLRDRLWEDGELLLTAADVEVDTAVSYETGSNTEHWSPRPDDGPVERSLVAVLLEDLQEPIEGWDGQGVPVTMYGWPQWLPWDVTRAVSEELDGVVRAGGGVPASLGAGHVHVRLGFGEAWQTTPGHPDLVADEYGPGQVLEVRAELDQSAVRAWSRDQQLTGLRAVAAGCLLAALPGDHGARPALERAVADGAELLRS